MMEMNCLIAEFENENSFQTAIRVLEASHFSPDEVSVVTKNTDGSHELLQAGTDHDTQSAPASEKTTAVATLVGGTLGAALGTMSMIGPFFVAGSILGMAAGAVGGSVVGSVEGSGISRNVAAQYEQKVNDGSILIIVLGDRIRLDEANSALMTTGPTSLERFAT